MNFFDFLRDWGLGALVFLGLATQPASFLEPEVRSGLLVFRLQDALPEEVVTLIRYGTEVSIEYFVRVHYSGVAFQDSTVTKKAHYLRSGNLTRCSENEVPIPPRSLLQAQNWLIGLEIPLPATTVRQVTVRAELKVAGRGREESLGLWGNIPIGIWRRNGIP